MLESSTSKHKLRLAIMPLALLGAALPGYAQQAVPAAGASSAAPGNGQPTAPAAGGPAQGPEPQASSTGGTAAAEPGEAKRVVYVPETVKAQLRQEIKEEVLAQAKQEGWAAPNTVPEWLQRFRPYGDIRARWERDIFAASNANNGIFLDFAAVNAGAPFDKIGVDITNDRYLNVDQNRSRPRLRARLGVDVDAGRRFTVGVRLASGDGSTPVSTNQTLGGAPGDFSKYQFWLDRAFLRYEPVRSDAGLMAIEIGRFENPFFTTSLVWSEDVNLDGVAVEAGVPVGRGVRSFLVAGAFPVFTTAFNFPPERPDKFKGVNKWLYALQLGAEWKPTETFAAKLATAFYYFDKLEGRISSPCRTDLKGFSCDTDDTRPMFAQKGNTYMFLRTPSDEALQAESTGAPEYQYFGLASRFRELAVTGRLEFRIAPPLKVTWEVELVRNVGFSRKQVDPVAVNNLKCSDPNAETCPLAGGDNGYFGRLTVGSPVQNESWSWSVGVAYRFVESDAVVDAFTDSDFGLGGTNLKGFTFSGTLAFTSNVSARLRWMSADQIGGPPFSVDILQVDLSARF